MTIDGAWSPATSAAVKRWQKAHGLTQSGTIELGRVVFLPGTRRIAVVGTTPGAPPPGNPILTTTSTRRRVTVALDTAKSALAQEGAPVIVVLPTGERVGGRITSVGRSPRKARRETRARPRTRPRRST